MARKKRIIEQSAPATAGAEQKPTAPYQDAFQHNVSRKIEDASRTFEGKGKNLLYGLAALAVLAVLIGIFFTWNRRSNQTAQTALGKAIETSQAQVSESPAPAGSTLKTFKTEKERAQASIDEFQAVADKFPGDVAEKARYFIAVNRLSLDRASGIAELETLAKGNDEVGKLSKFALAQTRADDGKADEAITLYKELGAMSDSIIAKDTINFQLAKLYEKQGKKDEAVNLYYDIAKAAAEAKDADGKPITPTATAREAREKLTALDPDRAKEIPEPALENPLG
jgi:predicted negative regulator of RcsB-dependent stress response